MTIKKPDYFIWFCFLFFCQSYNDILEALTWTDAKKRNHESIWSFWNTFTFTSIAWNLLLFQVIATATLILTGLLYTSSSCKVNVIVTFEWYLMLSLFYAGVL